MSEFLTIDGGSDTLAWKASSRPAHQGFAAKLPEFPERGLQAEATCGIVGEQTNKLVGYLAATSRKLRRPLAIVVQSSSSAGKSSLMDAVLSFIPSEDQVRVSAMTGQSLFYMGEEGLKHKLLAIAEDSGAEQAAYALKEQSGFNFPVQARSASK